MQRWREGLEFNGKPTIDECVEGSVGRLPAYSLTKFWLMSSIGGEWSRLQTHGCFRKIWEWPKRLGKPIPSVSHRFKESVAIGRCTKFPLQSTHGHQQAVIAIRAFVDPNSNLVVAYRAIFA